jgi:uncharacterized FAD-dependent dehydrogenase
MIHELDLRILPQQAVNEQAIAAWLSKEKGWKTTEITGVQVLKRSIDARQRTIFVNLRVRVFLNEEPQAPSIETQHYLDVSGKPEAIVVGAGPGGLFAALRLIQQGFRPIVVERGRNVHERRKDIATISREQKVDPESNYCFGEGGAGAFSDGKLYTRSKKRGNVDRILRILCQFGASPSILADAHPHVGTDKLPGIIERIREQIKLSGGDVRFETRMDDILIHMGNVVGIRTHTGEEIMGPVILATGHSARDVYYLLSNKQLHLEAKSLAMGVRLEHPQTLIDQLQYHSASGRGEFLPAAEYSLVTQVRERGVYSFCMCPGGFVVPAASGPNQVVVNGMSPSNRGSKWANAGLVVEIHPEDFSDAMKSALKKAVQDTGTDVSNLPYTGQNVPSALQMMALQEQLEYVCYLHGGSRQTAPVQRMVDFVQNRASVTLPSSSYTPGVVSSPLHAWLPPFIAGRLKEGFGEFDHKNRGFMTNQALLLGVETRTSSPVRIVRHPDTLSHTAVTGLYPCGEGAGYAGGIVSAAIDGERCAESLALWLTANPV